MWKEVAEQIGTDTTNVTLWVKNRTRPGLTLWPSVIQFLGYDPRPAAETVGKALKRYREGIGLSQEAFAGHLRVDQKTLAWWEQGIRTPRGKYLDRVKTVLARHHGRCG